MLSILKTRAVSYDRKVRRNVSNPRERDTKINKTAVPYSNKEDRTVAAEKHRGGSVDRRSTTKTRDESSTRTSRDLERIEKAISSQRSQQTVTTSSVEKQKPSTHRDKQSNEKLYKSSSSRHGDQVNRGTDKQKVSLSQKQSSRYIRPGRQQSIEKSTNNKDEKRQVSQKRHGEGRKRTRTYSIEKEVSSLKNEKSSPQHSSANRSFENSSRYENKNSPQHSSTNRSIENSSRYENKTSTYKRDASVREKSAKYSDRQSREKSKKKSINSHESASPSKLKEAEHTSKTELELPRAVSPAVSDYNYDDDFEEYESDFEEDDDNDESNVEDDQLEVSDKDSDKSEKLEISKDNDEKKVKENSANNPATIIHNERSQQENTFTDNTKLKNYQYPSMKVLSPEHTNLQKIENVDRKQVKKSSSRTFINFQSAKQQQEKKQCMNKLEKRGQELLEIITLDQITYEIFEMPPIKYDVYIRTFGRANTKQVYVQTEYGEDEEIQTEDITNKEKWTQMPAHDQYGVGGDIDEDKSNIFSWKSQAKTDIIYLNNFIQNAGRVMLNVLAEELAEISQQKLLESYTNFNFSEGFIQLGSLPVQKDCPVTYLSFSRVQTNFLLTIHATSTSLTEDNGFANKGVICIWNINQPSEPEKILTSTGQPICCCFGPRSANIVVSGMVDGSVSLWDLREFASWHPHEFIGDREWTLRTPTYSTATILKQEGHHSCVVAVDTLSQSSSDKFSSPQRKQLDSDSCFHVITLEDMSILNVWIVVEIAKRDASGSEGDLGLAPWGKIKLVKSSSILLHTLPGLGDVIKKGVRSFDFSIVSSNPSHMLVTTDTGAVIHCTRFNSKIFPRLYTSDSDVLIEARCIDFSPHDLPVFLVGSDDGNIRLHHIRSERALITWANTTKGKGIVQLKWSSSQPAVFYVLDADSCIHVWNLCQSTILPIQTFELSDIRISCVCLSNDFKVNPETSSGWPPLMAIAREDGIVEIHQISKKFVSISQQQYEEQKQCILSL